MNLDILTDDKDYSILNYCLFAYSLFSGLYVGIRINAGGIMEFAKEITSKTIDSNEEKVKIALSSTMGAIINYNSKGML